ncbi:cyclin-dependent kinases regulatory subunit-like [Anneissia japonica]|uniref:cyclin-dependent kinases regulatory subunit-like n=1 Tax=Anneissia japonica TaxID=1529436 RepID=UPI0014255F60|nr:cyclin-dependent kinases regulatory subunit-like [Anneissia japonica]
MHALRTYLPTAYFPMPTMLFITRQKRVRTVIKYANTVTTSVSFDEFQLRLIKLLHVILPPEIVKLVPRNHLMTETEWRNIGVQQSPGWIHYLIHSPEPHILLFRRPVSTTS